MNIYPALRAVARACLKSNPQLPHGAERRPARGINAVTGESLPLAGSSNERWVFPALRVDPKRLAATDRGFIFAKKYAAAVAVVAAVTVSNLANANVCDLVTGIPGKATATAGAATAGTGGALSLLGVGAVPHASGALIVSTASSGYVAGTLGAVGAVVGFLTAPVTLVAGGAALVTVGGAAAYCYLSK